MSNVIINDTLPRTQTVAMLNQTVYSTNWTADTAADVVVYSRAAGVPANDSTQILSSSAYNVAFIGDQQTVQVTLITPSAAGNIVTITRMTPADRLNLYTNTNFTPSMLNNDFGILTLVDQQAQLVNSQIGPRYNYSAIINNGVDNILPILGPNQVWTKNNDNTAIIGLTLLNGQQIGEIDFVIGTADSNVPNAQVLGLLDTGIVKNNAVAGTGTLTISPSLTILDSLPINSDTLAYGDGVDSFALTTFTALARTLLADTDTAGMQTTLGLVIGTNVQAWSAVLDSLTAGTYPGDAAITTVGTITTGTWEATPIGMTYGGTGVPLTPANGGIVYSTASELAILAPSGFVGQILQSGAGAPPTWSTAIYPASTTVNQLLYSSASNIIAGLTTANNGVLVTSNAGVPGMLANSATAGWVLTANSGAPPSWQVVPSSGTVNSGTAGTLGFYAINGTTISPLTLGTNLSITGTTLNATTTGSGTVSAGTTGTLGFYATNGTTITPLTLGTNLSITGTTLNATGGSGSGTVSSGTANQIAFYSATGTTVVGLTSANNATLITDASGVPSMSQTLPSGVQTHITQLGVITQGTWASTVIGMGFGGTGANLSAAVGSIPYSGASVMALLPAPAIARGMLWGNTGAAPTFAPYSMPATVTANSIPFASSTTAIGLISSVNNATLITNGSGVPSLVSASVNRQVIRTPVTTLATGTTLCVLSTLPITNTQGDQYISQAITPTVIGSIIEIEVQLYCGTTVAGDHIIAGIFQGSTVNAICGASDFLTAGGAGVVLTLKTWITTTSLSPITFAVRMGGSSAGTRTLNQYFGSTANSYMKLTESTS